MTITVNAVKPVFSSARTGDRKPDRASFFMELAKTLADQARKRKEQATLHGVRSITFDVGDSAALAVAGAVQILQHEGLDVALHTTHMVISW